MESKTIDHTKIQNKTKNHIKEDFKKKKNDSDVPILVNIWLPQVSTQFHHSLGVHQDHITDEYNQTYGVTCKVSLL
jgi:hypothetical protein